MERTQVHGNNKQAHWKKQKPSTKAHEVVRKGGRFDHVVMVGSRTACNAYWVSLPDSENYIVRVVKDERF